MTGPGLRTDLAAAVEVRGDVVGQQRHEPLVVPVGTRLPYGPRGLLLPTR
ncbi:hypothetical protein [Streptomyces sp. KL116D]